MTGTTIDFADVAWRGVDVTSTTITHAIIYLDSLGRRPLVVPLPGDIRTLLIIGGARARRWRHTHPARKQFYPKRHQRMAGK
jgi:hypothetical protein